MANIDLRKKVRVHVAFTEAFSALPLKELEIEAFFFFLAKLSKAHKDDSVYTLNLRDFEGLTGKQHNYYKYIDAFKSLRSITFEIQKEKSVLIDGLFSSAEIMEGAKTVEVMLSPKMKPYLINVCENWTEHQLYSMMRMKSKHAQKFYMYFCPLRPVKGAVRAVIEFEPIETLKRRLGYINDETGEELYKKSGHFINDVLEVVKKEINEVSNLRVSYKLKKLGRQYHWIEWTIENKRNEDLIPLESFHTKALEEKPFTERLKDIGQLAVLVDELLVAPYAAQKIVDKLTFEKIEEIFSKIRKRRDDREQKPIDDIGAYSAKMFREIMGTDLKI